MTGIEFKRARRQLGLSLSEMAGLLGVTKTHIRRMEMPTSASGHRSVMPRIDRLVRDVLAQAGTEEPW